jgi:hypothetical protein
MIATRPTFLVFFFFFFFFFFFSALQCIREVGLCACVLGSVGCACVDNACPKGGKFYHENDNSFTQNQSVCVLVQGECVDNLCEVAGLPSFVIPVAIVGGIVVLLAVVLVVVIVIRRKKADDGAMHAFNHSGANSGFGGTAPAFLSSSPSFYDPSPPPPTDFMQRSTSYDNPSTFSSPPTTFGSPPPTFGSPPPPPLSQQPSYVGHIYGGSPAADTSTVGFSSARGSHGQYSNIPASLAAS